MSGENLCTAHPDLAGASFKDEFECTGSSRINLAAGNESVGFAGTWSVVEPAEGTEVLKYALISREPDEPDKYRNMKVEGGTAGFWFYPDRGAIVLFPDLDVEENGIRIVTRYLGGTYGDPFSLPTDPSRSDLKEQRREYEMLYIE